MCCVLLALIGCISTPEGGYQVDEEPDKSVGSDVADRGDTEEEDPGVEEESGVVGCVLDGPLDGGPNISVQRKRNGLSSFASMASKENRGKRWRQCVTSVKGRCRKCCQGIGLLTLNFRIHDLEGEQKKAMRWRQ